MIVIDEAASVVKEIGFVNEHDRRSLSTKYTITELYVVTIISTQCNIMCTDTNHSF